MRHKKLCIERRAVGCGRRAAGGGQVGRRHRYHIVNIRQISMNARRRGRRPGWDVGAARAHFLHPAAAEHRTGSRRKTPPPSATARSAPAPPTELFR